MVELVNVMKNYEFWQRAADVCVLKNIMLYFDLEQGFKEIQ